LGEEPNILKSEDLFPSLIGKEFFAFPQDVKFIDIGTPSSYKEAETFLCDIEIIKSDER